MASIDLQPGAPLGGQLRLEAIYAARPRAQQGVRGADAPMGRQRAPSSCCENGAPIAALPFPRQRLRQLGGEGGDDSLNAQLFGGPSGEFWML